MTQITIEPTSFSHPVSRRLVDALNAELTADYPDPTTRHFGLDEAQVSGDRGVFLVMYRDGEPVGCGAVRRIDEETAELKRMYVASGVRGEGLGRRLVAALEEHARALGVRRIVLETGIRQAAAIALYRGQGFTDIPLFGEYLDSPHTSICLAKQL